MKQDELFKQLKSILEGEEKLKKDIISKEYELERLKRDLTRTEYLITKDVYDNPEYRNEKIRNVAIENAKIDNKEYQNKLEKIKKVEQEIKVLKTTLEIQDKLFKAYKYAYGCKEVVL